MMKTDEARERGIGWGLVTGPVARDLGDEARSLAKTNYAKKKEYYRFSQL